jgi:hypothetical protein
MNLIYLSGSEIMRIAKKMEESGLSSVGIAFITEWKGKVGPLTTIPVPNNLPLEDVEIIHKILGIPIM